MSPTLYMMYQSPGVRAVLMTAKAIGLDLNLKEMNYYEGDFQKPEFLKLNPQHTVPTLVEDDGFAIWDSHAISTYIISKYAKDDSLYPQDVQKRAIINQRLHFESGVIFPRLLQIERPILFLGRNTIHQEDKDSMLEAYGFLESFLEGKKWAAGNFLSVADYSLVSSVGSIATLVPIDPEKFPNVTAWLKRVESLPAYEVNKKGQQGFYELFKDKLAEG